MSKVVNNKFSKKDIGIISILSVGTFLEYLDFYLYIHMASLLNNIFFGEQTDQIKDILYVFTLSLMFIFRPIGAIIFGYIGDKIGRIFTVQITTILMAMSCLGIYFLPTFNDIGIISGVFCMFFRIIQSMSTMGELVGAQLYLSEFFRGTKAFVAIAILNLFINIGGQVAVGISNLAVNNVIDWRNAFLFGVVIIFVAYQSRKNVIEAKDYIKLKKNSINMKCKIDNSIYFYAFFLECMQPFTWFAVFQGCRYVLENKFSMTNIEIMSNTWWVSWAGMLYVVIGVFIPYFMNPYEFTKFRNKVNILLLLISPAVLYFATSSIYISILQALMLFFGISDVHMIYVIYRNIPAVGRFTVAALTFSLGRAVVGVLSCISIYSLFNILNEFIFLGLGLPIAIAYYISLNKFDKLEKQRNILQK